MTPTAGHGNMIEEIIHRLEKDLARPGGLGPQIVSADEAIVEKADLRALIAELAGRHHQ